MTRHWQNNNNKHQRKVSLGCPASAACRHASINRFHHLLNVAAFNRICELPIRRQWGKIAGYLFHEMSISVRQRDRCGGRESHGSQSWINTLFVLLAIICTSRWRPDAIATVLPSKRAQHTHARTQTHRPNRRNRLRNDWVEKRIRKQITHKTWRLFRLRCCSLNSNRLIYSMDFLNMNISRQHNVQCAIDDAGFSIVRVCRG